MDFMKEAAHRLQSYVPKQASIASTEAEIKRLEAEIVRIRSATTDSTPVSGGTNQREDMLINNIVMRTELKSAQEETREWLRITDNALSILTDTERRILDLMYIHRAKGNVDRLCEELHIEKPTVYRWRESALRRFTLALYGVAET